MEKSVPQLTREDGVPREVDIEMNDRGGSDFESDEIDIELESDDMSNDYDDHGGVEDDIAEGEDSQLIQG